MISTVFDYAIFCQAYMNGGTYGGKRLLSEALVKQAPYRSTATYDRSPSSSNGPRLLTLRLPNPEGGPL